MNKKQALVVQILAQKSIRENAVNRITAPDNLYDEVRNQFEKVESQLKDVKITVSVRGSRSSQKAVTWQPGRGLCVHDTGPSGFPHWSDLPDGVLLTAVSLLPNLLDQAHQIRTRNKSKDLEEGAKAVLKGAELPLMPVAPPTVRSVGPEDTEIDNPILEDEEDEDIFQDLIDDEEDDVEEEEEDTASLEVLGEDHFPEIDNTPQVVLEDLLPPVAAEEPKKTRRSRKK